MTIAMIDQVKMSNEDRVTMKDQISGLFKISQKQSQFTAIQIKHYYPQWVNIAKRLRTGAELVDETVPLRESTKESMFHLLSYYRFMLKVFGWYDMVFKQLSRNEDEFRRARAKILRIVNGEEDE